MASRKAVWTAAALGLAVLVIGLAAYFVFSGRLGTFTSFVQQPTRQTPAKPRPATELAAEHMASINAAFAAAQAAQAEVTRLEQADTTTNRISKALATGELSEFGAAYLELQATLSGPVPTSFVGADNDAQTQQYENGAAHDAITRALNGYHDASPEEQVQLTALLEGVRLGEQVAGPTEVEKKYIYVCGQSTCVHTYQTYEGELQYLQAFAAVADDLVAQLGSNGLPQPLDDSSCPGQVVSPADVPKLDIYLVERLRPGVDGATFVCGPLQPNAPMPSIIDINKDNGSDKQQAALRHELVHVSHNTLWTGQQPWVSESTAEYIAYAVFTPIYQFDPNNEYGFRNKRLQLFPQDGVTYNGPPKNQEFELLHYAKLFWWLYLQETNGLGPTLGAIKRLWAAGGNPSAAPEIFTDDVVTRYHDYTFFTGTFWEWGPEKYIDGEQYYLRAMKDALDCGFAAPCQLTGTTNKMHPEGVLSVAVVGPPPNQTATIRALPSLVAEEGGAFRDADITFTAYVARATAAGETWEFLPLPTKDADGYYYTTLETTGDTIMMIMLSGSHVDDYPISSFDYDIKVEDDGSGGGSRPPPPAAYGPYTDDQSCDNSGLCLYNHSGLSQTPPPACQYYGEHLPSGAEFCDSRNLHYLPGYTYEGCAPPTNPDGQLPPWENRDFQDGFAAGDPIPGDPYGAVQYVLLPPEERLCTIVFLNAVNADNNLQKYAGLDVALRYADGTPYVGDAYDPLATDQWGRAVWAGMPKLVNGDPAPYIMQVKVPADHVLVPSTGQSTVQIEGELWAQTQVTCFEGVCTNSVNTFRFRAE